MKPGLDQRGFHTDKRSNVSTPHFLTFRCSVPALGSHTHASTHERHHDDAATHPRARQPRWTRRLRPISRQSHAHHAQQPRLECQSIGASRTRHVSSWEMKPDENMTFYTLTRLTPDAIVCLNHVLFHSLVIRPSFLANLSFITFFFVRNHLSYRMKNNGQLGDEG